LEFNVPFQHKYGYIRDENSSELKKDGEWPPNSTHLNPMNYSIWGALQQLVYRRRRIRDVEHLKEVLQTCWEQTGQDVIDCTIGQFCKRLLFVVATGGGHTEHRFDLCFWCYTYIIMLTCFVAQIQNLDDKSK